MGNCYIATCSENAVDSKRTHARLNPERLQKLLQYEFQMWFERRMQAAGIDVVRLIRICNIDTETASFKSRYDFRPYLSQDFVSELAKC